MKVTNQTGTWVPLYVMTSEINDSMTREFFEEHDYFGYNKDYVKFFVQEMVPAVDFDGNLLMNLRIHLLCRQTETVDGSSH